MTPTEEKLQAIASWPKPTYKGSMVIPWPSQLLSVIISKLANVTTPLTDTSGSKMTLTWQAKHQTVYESLKQALILPPVLDYPRKANLICPEN